MMGILCLDWSLDSEEWRQAGSIWRVNGQNGEMVGTDSIQKPVVGRPVVFADRLWLSGADGTIHVVPIPSREGGQSS